MKKYFALLIIILVPFMADAAAQKAQKDSLASINGKIYDGSAEDFGSATFHPNIQLVTFDGEKPDTLYTVTGIDGVFAFRNIRPQRVYLKVFCVGRKTIEGYYELEAGRNAFFFTMEDAPQQIEESKVTAEVPLMKQIADTTIYNAAAVQTMDGESLRAILEQLPGFKVSRNRITVDGEEIKRTYINGVLVFGDNPLTAVGALKADEVSQVRVYDEQNAVDKRRGLKHSKKDRVLDVVTKEPLLQLAEAGVLGEGGADETGQLRYSGVAGVAYYSEKLLLSGYGYAGNTSTDLDNETYSYAGGKSVEDILDDGASNSTLSSYGEIGGVDIAIAKYWKDRDYGNNLNFKYDYFHKFEKDITDVLREYFACGGNSAMTELSNESDRNVYGRHLVRLNMDFKDTPVKSFGLVVEGSVSDDSSSSLIEEQRTCDNEFLSRHESAGRSVMDYSSLVRFYWTNNDAAKVRPSVNAELNFSKSNFMGWTVDTLATSFSKRYLNSDGYGKNIHANIDFNLTTALINNEDRTLYFNAKVSSLYENTKSKALALDEFESEIPIVNIANSYDNTWNNLSSSVCASINYMADKIIMEGSVAVRNVIQKDNEKFPASPYSSNENVWSGYSNSNIYWAVIPSFLLRYKTLVAEVSASSSVPSIEQKRNRISDSNPLALTGGNPNLKSSYSIGCVLRWNHRIAQGYGQVGASASADCGFRQIVTKTVYFNENTILSEWDGYNAMAGSMLYTFENASTPTWKTTFTANLSGLMFKRKLRASLLFNTGIKSAAQYYGADLISVKDINTGLSFNIGYRPIKILNLTLTGSSSYISSTDLNGDVLSDRFVSLLRAGATFRVLKYIDIDMDYNVLKYDYTKGAGADYSSHGLEVGLSCSLLKRSLIIYVKGMDLLDSGSMYNSVVTAEATTQTWKPVYGRFFILGIKYVFRKK